MAKGLIQTLLDSKDGVVNGYCRTTSKKSFSLVAIQRYPESEVNFSHRGLALGKYQIKLGKIRLRTSEEENETNEIEAEIKREERTLVKITIYFENPGEVGRYTAQLVE